MPHAIDRRRREFLGILATTLASTHFASPSHAKPSPADLSRFAKPKQVDAGALNVGYVEVGAPTGAPVILLHGWPYDIHSYEEAASLVAAAGFRVIVPHLRGFGTTRFLSKDAFRNAQQSAVALDVIALMDALRIEKAVLGGYDWGSRTANIIAALWPERCKAMVSVNGYIINNVARNQQPLPPRAEWGWWYQYYFATERGRAGLETNRRDLAKLIWKFNSPKWAFDDATFERAAASFDNPDYVSIVIHNYRWRLGLAAGDPHLDEIEKRLAQDPTIGVPTITLDGDSDGVVPAGDGSRDKKRFTGRRVHRVVAGAGHNLPQEAPRAFADAIIEVAGY